MHGLKNKKSDRTKKSYQNKKEQIRQNEFKQEGCQELKSRQNVKECQRHHQSGKNQKDKIQKDTCVRKVKEYSTGSSRTTLARLGWLWFGLAGSGLFPVSCCAVRTSNYHYEDFGYLHATGPLGPPVEIETERSCNGNPSLLLNAAAAAVEFQPIVPFARAAQATQLGLERKGDALPEQNLGLWFLGVLVFSPRITAASCIGPVLVRNKVQFFCKDLVGVAFGVIAFHIPTFQNFLWLTCVSWSELCHWYLPSSN